MTKQKEKKLEQKIINLTRSFIENNPTDKKRKVAKAQGRNDADDASNQ